MARRGLLSVFLPRAQLTKVPCSVASAAPSNAALTLAVLNATNAAEPVTPSAAVGVRSVALVQVNTLRVSGSSSCAATPPLATSLPSVVDQKLEELSLKKPRSEEHTSEL